MYEGLRLSYYGRGYIQLTWIFNYYRASYDLFGNDILVKEPQRVATDLQLAWQTTFWFWGKEVHDSIKHLETELADAAKPIDIDKKYFEITIKEINSIDKEEPSESRRKIYANVKAAFNLPF